MIEEVSDSTTPATRYWIVCVASRLFAAYLLLWALDDITLLPRVLLSVAHYMHKTESVLGANTTFPETTYWLRYYAVDLFLDILRIAVLLMAARWFYRCGPYIRKFLTAE